MSENQVSLSQINTNGTGTNVLRALLVITGVIAVIGGLTIAGLIAYDAYNFNRSLGQTAGLCVLAILGGLTLAVIMLAGAAVLGHLSKTSRAVSELPAPQDDVRPALSRLEQSMRLLNNIQSRQEHVRPDNGAPLPANLVAVLSELRDFTLMTDEQKHRFAARHWARRREALTDHIERDVLVGDWVAAFNRLEELQMLMPDDPQVSELAERVESEQSSRLEEDLRVARGQMRQHVATGAWGQAEELAADLQRKYPRKQEPVQFAEDVRREREAFEREAMERHFRDISSAIERRQWRSAVLAVEEFIRRYPNDDRTPALRVDLPTIQENAASHERKEQEDIFKEHLKNHRYSEAIAVARAVIAKYPQSPTAVELNKLLPRVEELSRQAVQAPAQPAAAPA